MEEETLIEQMTRVRVEQLNENALKLFNKIMKVIDERDELQQRINKTINSIETTIQIIGQQPSREEEDKYILDRLESFIKILEGSE